MRLVPITSWKPVLLSPALPFAPPHPSQCLGTVCFSVLLATKPPLQHECSDIGSVLPLSPFCYSKCYCCLCEEGRGDPGVVYVRKGGKSGLFICMPSIHSKLSTLPLIATGLQVLYRRHPQPLPGFSLGGTPPVY